MSKTAFTTELKQWHTKLELLYKEGQALFLRHQDTNHTAAKAVMPHLEMAKKATERVLTPDARPTD